MKYKGFICGLLAGVLVMITIPAFAESNVQISAWLQDYIGININGHTQTLPDDTHVLNYQNRLYLPLRYIAESLGADVEYDQTSQRVLVAMPTPEPTPVPTAAPETQSDYPQLPLKLLKNEMTLQIYGVSTGDISTIVYFDIDNQNPRNVSLDYANAYIEAGGQTYAGNKDVNQYAWRYPIAANSTENDVQLTFDPIPKDITQYIIHIPMLFASYDFTQGMNALATEEFVFHAQID